ncbi:hypothetical protein DACRYDRAFT_78439 [Dacryopinax primogenitus]|uniref:Alpha/beta hydrolase fold-3 domain-containing protein n=1 Tax=Dacryopinax primogenitus (strain DJM 731) TaxID=1858805 RepID=M5G1J6_DACPD|nr:uncharacterized protein DACRYDRAFT_78439 [Dacryopinax primogenitus]EJU02599.1 hypothetical protein DACRYDRAFT_78439 [Dacryopinax primogenitus]
MLASALALPWQLWPSFALHHKPNEDGSVEGEKAVLPDAQQEQKQDGNDNPEKQLNAASKALTDLITRLDLYRPGSQPPSSRITPSHSPLPGPEELLSLTGLWNYAGFLSQKAADVAGDVLRHQLWGPKKKSWGVRMTVLSAFMRGVGKYSALGNLALIRLLMSLPAFLPPSSEALITPIAFRVKRRGLRGLLAEYDAQEDGRREITAEWVVSKALWRKLNTEWKREHPDTRPGSRESSRQRQHPPRVKGRVILYLHGGAYYVFNASTHRPITIPLSHACSARVFAINYRLAPETRFPGPLHDAVSAYLRLTRDMAIPPSSILLAGDSAGGGLALALALYLRDNAYPLPAGLILLSPWVDLTMSSDSWDSNAAYDIVPVPPPTSHLNPVLNYLGPGPAGIGTYLTHPYASPLFGDLSRLPPLLVQCGDAEVLRDECALLAHKAARAGVTVKHEMYEDAVHVFQMLQWLPQTAKAWECVRGFVRGEVREYARRMKGECGLAAGAGPVVPEEQETEASVPAFDDRPQPRVPPSIHLPTPSPSPPSTSPARQVQGQTLPPASSPIPSLDGETMCTFPQSVVVDCLGEEIVKGREACGLEMERDEDEEVEGEEGEAEGGEGEAEIGEGI